MRRLNWIVVLLTLIICLSASAQTPRVLPLPRWQAALGTEFTQQPETTRFYQAGSTVIIAHFYQVFAFGRESGHELWRRSDSVVNQAGADIKSDLRALGVGNKDANFTRIYWQLVAVGSLEPGGPVVILRKKQTHVEPDPSKPNGFRSTDTLEEFALQAATGQTLWQQPAGLNYWHTTLVGNLLVDLGGNLDQAKPAQATPLRYRDAATGAALDANSREGQAAIQLAVQRQGKAPLLVSSYNALYSFDIKTATAACLYRASSYLLGDTLFPNSDRIAIFNNPDDDGAGHSVWAHYVDGTDRQGKPIWRFPRVTHTVGIDDPNTITEPYSIEAMAGCRAAGTVLCVTDGSFVPHGKPHWYGLDVRDGSIRWKSVVESGVRAILEFRSGFLMVTGSRAAGDKKSTLAWVEGRTGKIHWIAQTPPAVTMSIVGDQLLLVDTRGNLLTYSLKPLLPATARTGD